MDLDRSPSQMAAEAAAAVRALNHRTRTAGDDWQYPGDAYNVVGNLSELAMMLPQALEQVTRLIEDLKETGRLRSDKDTLTQDLDEVFYGLGVARDAAQQLYSALNRAHNGLGSIGYQD
ncbi:hypothetical protein [Streptomyces violaceorubidus]|uniref:hypothetical protein n=1 Tax=Streptomyces violaceorubidus TaxID=284042 RepID=UPI0006913B86|nr:hypothetical protein [Streptomyces violaceorubidus]